MTMLAMRRQPSPTPKRLASYSETKIQQIQKEICDKYGVEMNLIFSASRVQKVVMARRELIHALHHRLFWNADQISKYMDMDRTSVSYHLGLRKKSVVDYDAFNAHLGKL